MRASPHSPRRQRKALYTAHTFQRRRRMTVPLSRDLRARFHARSLPLRKGDTVRVLAGSFVGREERVARVDRRSYSVILDNVTLKTGEEKLKPLPIRTTHLVITRLNLSDAWRRRALQVSDADVTPEERGESPEVEETTEGAPVEAPKSEPAALPPPAPKRASKRVAPTPDAEAVDAESPPSEEEQ
ncbi:MAG: 50S ribosomal protein L24 [Thermoplasmata archaeon]